MQDLLGYLTLDMFLERKLDLYFSLQSRIESRESYDLQDDPELDGSAEALLLLLLLKLNLLLALRRLLSCITLDGSILLLAVRLLREVQLFIFQVIVFSVVIWDSARLSLCLSIDLLILLFSVPNSRRQHLFDIDLLARVFTG